MGNSHGNFQLHRFTRSENIAKSFSGGYFFLTHTVDKKCIIGHGSHPGPAVGAYNSPQTSQLDFQGHSVAKKMGKETKKMKGREGRDTLKYIFLHTTLACGFACATYWNTVKLPFQNSGSAPASANTTKHWHSPKC